MSELAKVWTPQPRQALFMSRPEWEAFYGGAAGGGKSDVLVVEGLRQVDIPWYKGIIFRKTYRQLGELLDKADRYYKRACPGARYNGQQSCWRFPSGAKIYFAGMQYTKDREKWQGWQFDYIAFDELTHFTYDEYSYMFSRNRPSGPGTRVYIRATGNPGGIGHGWVKQRFITVAPPMTPVKRRLKWIGPDGTEQEGWRYRIFIPAKLTDNQALMQNSPEYMLNLSALPEKERAALRDGNWDSFSGQVFTEWRNDSDHYEDHLWTHVIEPFLCPKHWRVLMGYDWGYSKPFACGWYAVDERGKMYMIRELYGCTGDPDVGVQWDVAKTAAEIHRIEDEDPNLKGRRIERIADPAIFQKNSEGSIAELFERNHVYFEHGEHERISGKMQMHYRLQFDEIGEPMLQVFSTCTNFIRTLPSLVYSDTDVEDVDTRQEDHLYDQCRYVMMKRRMSPKVPVPEKIPKSDPLNLWTAKRYGY